MPFQSNKRIDLQKSGFWFPSSCRLAVALAILLAVCQSVRAQSGSNPPASDLGEFFPAPPSAAKTPGLLLTNNLADVPDVELLVRRAKPLSFLDGRQEMARLVNRIRELNKKERDGFILALLRERPHLAGLPVTLNGACRQSADANQAFRSEVGEIRARLMFVANRPEASKSEPFWDTYEGRAQRDAPTSKLSPQEMLGLRYGALMQMLGPEPPGVRRGLVRHLSETTNSMATRALAQLAVFSPEEEVRSAAIDALRDRSAEESTESLLKGLRYPWLPIVERAAEAVVKLNRSDLAPRLVDMLDEPGPRAPAVREVEGTKTTVVREMVRINHHRSCLLCHAPAEPDMPASILTAKIPLPDEPLPTREEYYQPAAPTQMVRLDVTYLRQDFSVMLTSPNLKDKGRKVRYDFVVRERALTDDEAARFRKELDGEGASNLPPHRAIALAALRQLTGKDAAPTASAWKEMLK